MPVTFVEIRVKGRNTLVPSVKIGERTVIARGGPVRIASIRDEHVTEGELVSNPPEFISALTRSGLRADVLTFFQRPPDTAPKFAFPLEMENYAAVPITTFDAWWVKLPQTSRKNTRRAMTRGVEVKTIPFDETLVRGIHRICNETPLRQGRPFWHYGKDIAAIRREHATYIERSEFIGAFFNGDLIGFIKMVYVDRLAAIMAILALESHRDKRPMNALLTKAVGICVDKGCEFFIYGNYTYGNKKDGSLVEFKQRNGFLQLDFPRYYIPITLKGRLYVALKLYRGLGGLVPASVLRFALRVRKRFFDFRQDKSVTTETQIP